MQDVAKEIERVMLEDIKSEVTSHLKAPLGALNKPLANPDTARGELDRAIEQLQRVQDDAKVLAQAIQAIQSACAKMASEVSYAREAIAKARGRL